MKKYKAFISFRNTDEVKSVKFDSQFEFLDYCKHSFCIKHYTLIDNETLKVIKSDDV